MFKHFKQTLADVPVHFLGSNLAVIEEARDDGQINPRLGKALKSGIIASPPIHPPSCQGARLAAVFHQRLRIAGLSTP